MKKISIFLAALMFFMAVAVLPGNVQEVKAYSYDEMVDWRGLCDYKSGNAGARVTISGVVNDLTDLTGAKAALCPKNNYSLEAAVAVWNISNDDKASSTYISKNVVFESDIPEGKYDVVFFDASGTQIGLNTSSYTYVNKFLVDFTFSMMNDDGYVYAYVYADNLNLPEGVSLDESYCPVLYDLDQETPLTSYDAFTSYVNTQGYNCGERVYVYRLNVSDMSWIDVNDFEWGSFAYYNNTNSQIGMTTMNEKGMGLMNIYDANKYADIHGVTIVSPFDDNSGSSGSAGSGSGSTELVNSSNVTGKSRFVALLYENVLERYATESEVAGWVQELENGKTGAEVAYGFIFSQEFTNKNLSNSDYVERLYMSMMGRASDEGGKSDWVNHLNNGVSRLYVFKQFINSQEFANLCEEYAIVQGDVALGEARDENYDVTRFVARNYREFLGRDYDESGLNDWTSRINNREQTMQDIASGFVFSQECTNMNLSNEEYVQMLYRGCFDRTGDEAGVADWVTKLNAGTQNREEVFLGFANSQEFANMVSSYGL